MKNESMQLTYYDHLPDGILDIDASQLHEVLPGPSLIKLQGRHAEFLFISVLLHGNEITGWDAVRQVLKKYQGKELPRSVCLLIGNVVAARYAARHLPEQEDYNRIWKCEDDTPAQRMAQQVLDSLDEMTLFAAVDVHNNTGKNPHYACVNRLKQNYLYLASLFSRTVVYFLRPDTVMSMAMASRCPAVTVECGQPGQPQGVEHAVNFLDASLHLSEFPKHPMPSHELDVFHTVATVKITPGTSIGFGDEAVDCNLVPDIDRFNFSELPVGTALGQVREADIHPFEVQDEKGNDVTARYFTIKDRWILTRTPFMPSMLTLDREIINQDCLCYLMERISIQ